MFKKLLLAILLSASPLWAQSQFSGGGGGVGAAVTSAITDKGGQVYNVKAYGAKGDGVFLYTCSATNGSTAVTCTDGAFTEDDVGKIIEIDNSPGSQPDITLIASVVDATHIAVEVGPSFTKNPTSVVYGTDDTTAIQTLINTVFAAGGGTIFFPTANYILAGALGGPDTQNGILYIPQIDTSPTTANNFPTLTLAGPGTPSTETLEAPYATFKPTTSSAVLYGMTWGNGAGAIISGPTAIPFDSCTVVLKDLSLRTRQNPDITGLQFQFVKNAIIRRVSAGVNISSSINVPQPTFTTVAGIKMPTTASSGVKDVDGYWAYGFYTGLEVSEHANIRNYEGHQLFYGLTIDSNAVHAVFLSNVNIEASKHVLNIGGPTPVFGTVDVEHETSGWYTAIDDLIVSTTIANQARGALFMTVYRPGTGYVSPTMNVLPRYISVWAYGFGQVGGLNYDAAFTFAQISATPVINGARLYCSDCKNVATDGATFDSAIASGGTGTPVVGENGAWRVH